MLKLLGDDENKDTEFKPRGLSYASIDMSASSMVMDGA